VGHFLRHWVSPLALIATVSYSRRSHRHSASQLPVVRAEAAPMHSPRPSPLA